MKTAEMLYKEAMEFDGQAEIARIKRLPVDYKALYGKASQLEFEAAERMIEEGYHPSQRITRLRSAAALAYKADNFSEAEKIIALARSENPDGYETSKLDDIEDAIREAAEPAFTTAQLRVTGALTAADADENEIKIRDLETRQLYSFIVPANMFRKVVKKHWLDVVQAVGKASPHGVFTLEKISPAA